MNTNLFWILEPLIKIVKGFEGLKENDFFERSEEDITRGHSYKF